VFSKEFLYAMADYAYEALVARLKKDPRAEALLHNLVILYGTVRIYENRMFVDPLVNAAAAEAVGEVSVIVARERGEFYGPNVTVKSDGWRGVVSKAAER